METVISTTSITFEDSKCGNPPKVNSDIELKSRYWVEPYTGILLEGSIT